ncbi:beta-ketothiolase BktB [Sphingomonas solaris]|uniref:Acetyl-CoA C-acyltransferase n=1 Tax=Alterirhizorhabdus solaris TaxID=2529389 RepID=A0A558QX05_9SPHN|nr:beta-ketothiolase BktB [Sphingomonas solaris]TVV71674.1 acetyl-CoA C-acyltransferase [Sphingomonas solaris]
MNDVYLVSAVRTAIGTFGGALKDQPPAALATLVVKEALSRAKVDPADVGQIVFGQVVPSEPSDAYLARIAGVNGGLPVETPALSVNRLCGSGLQAIVTAAQGIMLGDYDVAVAGGVEVMSKAPFFVPGMRFGHKLGDATMQDALLGGLTDPFDRIHMGVTAENVADKYDVTREDQDALALRSHQRAAAAIAEGRFKDQILPVEVKVRGKKVPFDTDEHVRADAKAEDFARLKPVFRAENGSVTAGNASGINDGASAVVLASGEAVKAKGLKPLARLVAYANTGVEPKIMGIGPVSAVKAVLKKAGLTIADIDVIEANEAFAAQACAVAKELGFDPAKLNVNGSGISLGHPIGATGAILATKLVYELARTGGRYGLATMCIGGGQGIAAVFERV